ncbi:MAG TPA: hypothetical protein VI636_03345 [Candidatus Angelobacter sp.]
MLEQNGIRHANNSYIVQESAAGHCSKLNNRVIARDRHSGTKLHPVAKGGVVPYLCSIRVHSR